MKNIEILKHIQEDIEDIILFISDLTFDSFVKNHMIRKAVCMSLINIGELTKVLSPAFKSKYSYIPWKNIAGLRDVTAHKYHTLNLDIIWAVATIEIPKLNEFVNTQLEKDNLS